MNFRFLVYLLIVPVALVFGRDRAIISSPDGTLKFYLHENSGVISYEVTKNNRPIVGDSRLGIKIKDGNFENGFTIKGKTFSTFDETWQQPWGEEIDVRNQYNELFVTLVGKGRNARELQLRVRVFNDGFGFRYEFPEQKNLKEFTIVDELTEFSLLKDHKSWSLSYNAEFYEGLYRDMPISKLDTVSSPLTIEEKDGLFLAIHEANLTNYASMNLHPVKGRALKLKVFLTPWSTGDKVYLSAPAVSPWRTMIVADNAGDLITSRLMLNLNEPNQIKDTSWIEPGRYIGVWWGMHMKKNTWEPGPTHGAKTENVLKYIDFASTHNFSGVLVEGWNKGWEDWKSFEFYTPYPDFDIEKITKYAKEKGVRLIGHHETGGNTKNYEKQMDSAFAFYNKYGVKAVKTGYVGGLLDGKEKHGSQYGVRHYRKVIETAAKHQIMIDNHEPAMPTGLQRTFPNLMTQEGLRGQEWDAWSTDGGNPPNHTTIIPFTRGLAGPMDFTPGTFNFTNTAIPGTRVQTTLAKQLALSVILYSPLQMASDMIENYENIPAFEFITKVPTTWSKTLVPHAKIGEYVTIARKTVDSGDWYVGSITNENARELSLSLDFLEKDAEYQMRIFEDGKEADYKSNPYEVAISERKVRSTDTIKLKLATSGGAGIIFHKIN